MPTQISSMNPSSLQPFIDPDSALTMAGQFAANLTVLQGTRIGQIASSGLYTNATLTNLLAAPVSGPTVADGATGTTPAGVYYCCYTYVNALGETTVSPITKYTSAGTVLASFSAVTPLPTGAVSVNWYASVIPGSLELGLIKQNNGAAFTMNLGAAPVAEWTRPPLINTASVDGSSVPVGIAKWNFVTDANGLCYLGVTPPTTGYAAMAKLTDPFYVRGYFLMSDLPSITAAEVALMHGYILGSGANAIVRIP